MMDANDKRIAKNTLLLYVRMMFIMLVTFYISRVTLSILGAEDYGIYSVVGGIVVMFSMFTGSLTSAVNRFLSVELGRGNEARLPVIFSSAVNIQICLSLVVLLLAELLGVWFLNHKMNIPADRMYAANWVFQCSMLTFTVNLVAIPYQAVIIARERMQAFACISILDILLKLGAACFLLLRLFDGLIVYAQLLLVEAVAICFVYGIYCRKHFEECRYRYTRDTALLKEMTSFAGWNFIGVTSGVLRDQGVNILLNLFFNPLVNAARAIAVQVGTAVNAFANNFITALNPQIMKSYAAGDRQHMTTLVYQGTRLAYYLLLLISLPLLFGTQSVLTLWLKSFPEHTVSFVRLMLLFTLSESISQPLVTSMFATGRIRNYQLVVGGTQMLIFPLSYLTLHWGATPETAFYITIAVSQICLFLRLFMLRSMIGLDLAGYIRKVYLNLLGVSAAAAALPLVLQRFVPDSFGGFLILSGICIVHTLFVVYRIGCSAEERRMIRQGVRKIVCKIVPTA